MHTTREIRSTKGLELRAAPEGSGLLGVLAGYASVFDSDSVLLGGGAGGFIERVAPGAFTRTLAASPDVYALWQHDPAQVLARSPDTLTLAEDARGLRVEISLPDTTTARDLLARIRAGIVDAMSFGFTVRGEKWEQRDGQPDLRTLTDLDLFEVSAVVWPAYPDTTLALRSREDFLRRQAPPAPAPVTLSNAHHDRERRARLLHLGSRTTA